MGRSSDLEVSSLPEKCCTVVQRDSDGEGRSSTYMVHSNFICQLNLWRSAVDIDQEGDFTIYAFLDKKRWEHIL
ncbi:Highly reducing polyketide synthase azaB [Fusarium oxysporum f. sp. albedinis]|nr:Highly reducing polyketide synthase azaB [Fusarium oxysporum f. sp. albedinis]